MLKKHGFGSVISFLSSYRGAFSFKNGLAFALLALCFCSFGFSTDFSWTGGGVDSSNWNDPDNWSYNTALGTDPDGYPNGADDSVSIADANVDVTGDVTCGSITMTGSSSLSIGGKLTNTGAISASGCDITLGVYEGADTTPRANIDCRNFTVNGEVIFRGYVRATSISVTGKITFGGAVSEITTSANQYYGGEVDINGTFLFTSTAGTITFNSNIRSWSPLAANLKPLNINGNVVFNSVVGRVDAGKGTLSSISVSGNTSVGGNVTSSGTQTYSGDVSITASTALTFSTGGALTFGAKLTGNSGSVYLASDTPVTTYDIHIRGDISGVNDIYFNGPTFFDGSGTTDIKVTSVGYQHYNAEVTLAKDVDMRATGGAGKYVSLKKDVIGGGNNLSINAANVNFGSGTGESVTGIANLALTATESIALNVQTLESTGLQSYSGPTVLKTSVNYDIGNGEIVLNGTVDADTASTQSLAFTGTGLVTIRNKVGSSKRLSSFSVAGTTEVFSSCTAITTSGAQTYSGNVTVFSTPLALSATTVNFGAKLDGATALSVAGNAIFGGAVGSVNPLSSIAVSGTSNIGANIATTGAQTYTGNASLATSVSFTAPTLNLVSFGAALTDGVGSYAINIVNANVYVGGAVSIDGNFTAGGDAQFASSVNCASLTVAKNAIFASDVSSTASIAVTGTTSFSSSTAQTVSSTLAQTYTGVVNIGSATAIFSSTGGNLNFGTGATSATLISGVSGYSLSVSTSGTYSTNFYGVIANNPSLTITGNANIYATNTYTSLTAQGQAGKTLNFATGTKQTVTQKLFLSGTEGSNLTLTSSGTWELILNPHTIADSDSTYEVRYVDLDHCTNNTKDGAIEYFLTALDSNDNGANVYWNFPGMVYKWEGDISDDWFTAGNWDKNSVPGRGSVVTIPTVSAPAVYPLLSSDVDIAYPSYENLNPSYPGTITVQNSGEFDLYNYNVKSGSLTNNGTVRLFGSTNLKTQSILSTMVNGSASTVEYYGTDIIGFVWDGDAGATGYQHQNLRIVGSASISAVIGVAGLTTINTSGNVSLTGANVFTGDLGISLGRDVVLNSVATGFALSSGASCQNLSVLSPVILRGSVTTTGSQTYGGAVTLGANSFLSGTGVSFTSTVAGSFALNIIGNASFSGAVTVGTIEVTGTTNINTVSITTTGAQTYIDDMEISFGARLRAGANILISSSVAGPGYLDVEVYELNSFTSSALLGDSTALSKLTITAGKINLNGFNSDGQVVVKALPSTGTVFDSGTEENIINLISGSYTSSADQSFTAVGGVRVLNSTPIVWNANAHSITLLDSPLFVDSISSLTLSSSLASSNIYFYSGSITSSSSITSENDFAVWGAFYSDDDPRFAGVDSRFAFYGYEDLVYKASSSFATNLTLTGSSLTVGKNFYLNGASLSDVSLSIPDNSQSNPVFNPTSSVTEKQWGLPYAVAFNSTINNLTVSDGWLCAGGVDSETLGQTQGNTLTGKNSGVQGEVPRIVRAYSVFDDVIYVEFNMKLENSNGELANNIALSSTSTSVANGGIFYSNKSKKIVGVYTDADCATPLTAIAGDVSSFYIRAEETWNTDATGLTSYNPLSTTGSDSTDRSGTHKNLTTDLSMLEGLFTAAEGHTMSRNYGAGLENSATPPAYTAVEDRANPVLIAVYTGQEKHTAYDSSLGAQSQPDYDSHNFIEFRYSEAVNIGDLNFNLGSLNARASASFANTTEHGGHITGAGTQGGNGLTITGFANLSSGKLLSGSKDGSSAHALYRSFSTTGSGTATAQTHRVRLSIGGYVDGTVSYNSDSYKNWIGYIDSSQTPSGSVIRVTNPYITDVAQDSLGNDSFNGLDSTGTENHPLPALEVNSTTQELYGIWDVLPPVIVPFSTTNDVWESWRIGGEVDSHEIIGSSTGSYIEAIEVHLFDNNQEQNTALGVDYWWKSKKGWMDGIQTLPDTFGGSRPFVNTGVTGATQTTGGIRRSSLHGANSSFSYIAGSSTTEKQAGTSAIGQVVRSSLFRASTDSATANDGLYLSIPIHSSDTYLPVRTAFKFYYDPSNSFITDLAGNRLSSSYSAKTSFSSIDLTPPAYVISLAPIGHNSVYVIFTKRLAYTDNDNNTHYLSDLSDSQLTDALDQIKESFIVCQRNTDTPYIAIESVEYVSSSAEYTALLFNLVSSITLTDIKTLWLRNTGYQVETVGDIVTGDLISDTKIHDYIGNYLPHNKAHAISDFAVNAVDVLYAHASETNDDSWDEQALYGNNFDSKTENYAVHDFSETQGNYGKLVSGRDIVFRTRIIEGLASDGSYLSTSDTFTLKAANKSSVTTSMASDKLNLLTGSSWRLWLPTVLTSLASQAKDTVDFIFQKDDTPPLPPTLFNYTFAGTALNGGDEIQFLFEVDGVTIDHDADDDPGFSGSASPTPEVPLYAVWMPEARIRAGDFSFVDLWSFGIKDQSLQKGGVSIFNNVINVNVREQTVVQVDMPREGALNVFVMTLDGNIVKRLAHGRTLAGTHYFRWDGTNNAGNPVARGLYFVRVTGPGIDETRKVLTVKE